MNTTTGDQAFLVLFIIATGGGGLSPLYFSDIDNYPDSHSPLILSLWASPYPPMFISFPFSFSAGFLTAVQCSIERGGVIGLRYYSSSAGGFIFL